MRLAIPHWKNRVSPVLDVAETLLLANVDKGLITSRLDLALDEESPLTRAKRIEELGVNVLICGAISWPLELALVTAGIEVISQACGEIDQVLDAFLSGRLDDEIFLMPGCCGRKKDFSGGRCRTLLTGSADGPIESKTSEHSGKDTKVVAEIDVNSCVSCAACVDACSHGAIQMENGIAQVKEEDCTGCGDCAAECPVGAIRIA